MAKLSLKSLSPNSMAGFPFRRLCFQQNSARNKDGFPRNLFKLAWEQKGQVPAVLLGTAPTLTKTIHHSRSLPFSRAARVGNGSGLLTEHCLRIV